jgi:hypothetical protein
MRDFLTDKDQRRMVFIKGSVHQNHIDAPFIFKSVTIKKIIGQFSQQCCGSEIITGIYLFSYPDPDPTVTLISDPDSNPVPDPACL